MRNYSTSRRPARRSDRATEPPQFVSDPSGRACDVGLGEIVALEQQRLARGPRERVGECVADVQTGGVAAPAEATEGFTSDLGLIGGDRRDLDRRLAQEQF